MNQTAARTAPPQWGSDRRGRWSRHGAPSDPPRSGFFHGDTVNAAVELVVFQRIFIAGGVYDPVTDALLHALRILPL